MTPRALTVDVLVGCSLLVTVLAVFGAVVLRTTLGRLHFVTPVTSVAAPLLGLALVIDTGWGITAGLDLLIVTLLALSGPVLQVATGRVEAQRTGAVRPQTPQ